MTRCIEYSGGKGNIVININEVIETNNMIEKENLDVRTITMGISLCIVYVIISIIK